MGNGCRVGGEDRMGNVRNGVESRWEERRGNVGNGMESRLGGGEG